jgi:hypothetical protein
VLPQLEPANQREVTWTNSIEMLEQLVPIGALPTCLLMSITGAFTKAPVSIATTPAMGMKSQMDQQIASFGADSPTGNRVVEP